MRFSQITKKLKSVYREAHVDRTELDLILRDYGFSSYTYTNGIITDEKTQCAYSIAEFVLEKVGTKNLTLSGKLLRFCAKISPKEAAVAFAELAASLYEEVYFARACINMALKYYPASQDTTKKDKEFNYIKMIEKNIITIEQRKLSAKMAALKESKELKELKEPKESTESQSTLRSKL